MDWLAKRDWIDALRSRKYKQGRRRLHPTPDTYCCLGVLADVLGEEWEFRGGVYILGGVNYYLLLDRVLNQVCMTDAQQRKLVDMNDDGFPFAQIADYIEDEIPGEVCE